MRILVSIPNCYHPVKEIPDFIDRIDQSGTASHAYGISATRARVVRSFRNNYVTLDADFGDTVRPHPAEIDTRLECVELTLKAHRPIGSAGKRNS
jgi:hypothetical protein